MNIYQNATDEELMQAYTSMMDYSGKITAELRAVIDAKGGLAQFKQQIEFRKRHLAEINRVAREVRELTSPEVDIEFVRKLITSSDLSTEALDALIELEFARWREYERDQKITSNTIVVSLVGVVVGIVVGTALLFLSVLLLKHLFYFLLVPVYIVNYLIIRLITKQSRNNPAVFIACLAATIGALIAISFIVSFD